MNTIRLLILVLIPFASWGQTRMVCIATTWPKEPLYILDDSIVGRNQIDTTKTVVFYKLTDALAQAIYGVRGSAGVFFSATRNYAIRKYENKLGALSKKYRLYIAKHHGVDNKIIYILDGVPLNKDTSQIKQLYGLGPGEIKKLVFSSVTKSSFEHPDAMFLLIETQTEDSVVGKRF